MSFRSSGSQQCNALNGAQFGIEMKELQPLQEDHSKLKAEWCTTAKSAFGCENIVLLLRKFRSHFAQCRGVLLKLPDRHFEIFCFRYLIQSNSEDFSSEDERLGSSSLGVKKAGCACHIEYEIAEEAMNFMSYVAEVSRGWDEPNARNMGRMTSQPNAKGEMYILNDGIDMKAKIAAMARRLKELEMKNMQEVQAISRTPLQPMPCAICLSYEHLVDECPTIPTVREMFGDCNTYNSNWRDHPNFSWKPQPPQYKQPAQEPQQASNLEQAMVNLSKVMGDFVGAQKSINAQLSQRIDSVESSLNKRMDKVQNDLSQKIDNLQYSISRFANLNKVQEKGNFPFQPHQNSKGIHQVEAQKGESSMVKEVKMVITLRSGKEVDLPTSKLEYEVKSETEKENREEIKGKRKGKSIEKDDYDLNVDEEPQRIVIKEEMKKHMPPPFPQALYGKIIQTKSQVRDANFIWDPGKLNQDQIF
uniref:Retrotransposon gag domain-containing protein n=1 Tax=Vitis vinifera TaxID=29760 RepID=A5AI39_VITVI|nr:hypothetical protein VITISV_014924 [Vitis vinifera]